MSRDLVDRESHCLGPGHFAEHMSGALMHRDAALQVGQRECRLPVAAVRSADQLKECGVLVNCQQLTVAERPTLRREVAAEHPNFADKRI
jgi:hypothetical protein